MHARVTQRLPGDYLTPSLKQKGLLLYRVVISAHYGQQPYIKSLFLLSSDVSGLHGEDHCVGYKWRPFRLNSTCHVRVMMTPVSELTLNKDILKCGNI